MRLISVIAISGVILAGCGKSIDVDSESQSFTIPMACGNQWTYRRTWTWDKGDPPTIHIGLSTTVAMTVDHVDTILPGVPAYVVRCSGVASDTFDRIPEQTYLNLSTGMYLLPPNTSSRCRQSFPMMPRHVPDSLSWMSDDQPFALFLMTHRLLATLAGPAGLTAVSETYPADTLPLILAYPQSPGQAWTHRDTCGIWEYQVERVIEEREMVTTPAGSFDCWRIRSICGPPFGGLTLVEYISDHGLIRRRMEVPISGGLIGQDLELISLSLH
jgi:hypothetical protein